MHKLSMLYLRYGHFVNKVCMSDSSMRRDRITVRDRLDKDHITLF